MVKNFTSFKLESHTVFSVRINMFYQRYDSMLLFLWGLVDIDISVVLFIAVISTDFFFSCFITELKEKLNDRRIKCAKFKPYHPNDLTCHICLKKGDHWSSEWSYLDHYPAGAIVGPSAAIVCVCCGKEDAHPGKPGLDWGAIAVRKTCYACGCPSDHWDKGCPKAAAIKATASKSAAAPGSGMEASASKGAGAGTGIKASSSKGAAAVTVTSTSS